MPAAKSHHLRLYRRHAETCPEKKDALNCNCPLWVHGRVRGKFIRTSLSTRSIDSAQAKIKELLGEESSAEPGRVIGLDSARMTLRAALDSFYAAKRKRKRTRNTLTNYRIMLEPFVTFAEQHALTRLAELQPATIERYFDSRAELAASSRVVHLTNLRVFLKYCVEQEWITRSPAAKQSLSFPIPKENSGTPFSHSEITKILRAIRTDEERAIVLTLLYSGMRISDTAYLERGAVSRNGILNYVVIKTKRKIGLPPELNPAAVKALRKVDRGTGSFWFIEGDYPQAVAARHRGEELCEHLPAGFYRQQLRRITAIVENVLRRALVTGSAHKFRHTFAVHMLTAGTDVYVVSEMLGHTDLKVTKKYLNLVPGYREKLSQATRLLNYPMLQLA